LVRSLFAALAMSAMPAVAFAQVTPATGFTPPDDTPSIRVGTTIYADYTYTVSPTSTDVDGNEINPNSFNITRSYINVIGNVSHIVGFRVTPDIVRETGTGTSLNGSLVFRLKYAFAQFNLDDWMSRGSWARFGIQQTPWVEFEENIYRYRFQGTVFAEREGYLSSSDAGASFHYNLPSNYGDIHVGAYNGENYYQAEINNQKSIQVRASIRPFATGRLELRGLRGHFYYDGDAYVSNAERKRLVAGATFEHQYVNAGFDYLNTNDQLRAAAADVEGQGYSIWVTPRSTIGWEALLRFDHMKPNTGFDTQVRHRTILGAAYWFPHQGNVSSALLVDYDQQTFDNFAPALPAQKKVAVHGLVAF
jgi:hypothetical protein